MTVTVFHDEHQGARRIGVTGEAERSSVLLVGEANPYDADPGLALWPAPRNAAGYRLQKKILQLDPMTYYGTWRTNLCPSSWDRVQARYRVVQLLHADEPPWSTVVCLGRKVSDAFAVIMDVGLSTWSWYPLFLRRLDETERVIKVVSIPHPSGLSRAYNDPAAAARARELLREVAPAVPWGELASRIPPPA